MIKINLLIEDNVVIIPYLYDLTTKQFNMKGLFEIKKYLLDY